MYFNEYRLFVVLLNNIIAPMDNDISKQSVLTFTHKTKTCMQRTKQQPSSSFFIAAAVQSAAGHMTSFPGASEHAQTPQCCQAKYKTAAGAEICNR